MADFGSPVAQNVTPPNLQTLSGLLALKQQNIGIQQAQQNLQTGQYNQQTVKAESTIAGQNAKENQGLAQLLADPVGNGITDADGTPLPGAFAKFQTVAPTGGAAKYQQWIDAAHSKVQYTQSVNDLNESQRAAVAADADAAAQQGMTRTQFRDRLVAHMQQNPAIIPSASIILQQMPSAPHLSGDKMADGVALKNDSDSLSKYYQGVATSFKGATPSVEPGTIQTGANIQPGAVNRFTGAFSPAGKSIHNELPPTTPTFNPKTNTPGYLGSQGKGGQIQSGPAIGTESSVSGSVKVANDDYADTVAKGSAAPGIIATLGKIKEYAPGAATGVASDRRSLISGIGGLIGLDSGEMTKTNTDLLAKNSNLLALTGGNTDLAMTLAQASNPNNHMTKEAIAGAADQLSAVQKYNLAKQRYMTQFKGKDPSENTYSQALSNWNNNTDSRVMQMPYMSQAEVARMKSSMSPVQQQEFRAKAAAMKQMGLIQRQVVMQHSRKASWTNGIMLLHQNLLFSSQSKNHI